MQPEQLKGHMVTIGVDKLLSNSAMTEHRGWENIEKLYKYSGKCDDKNSIKTLLKKLCYLLLRESQNTVQRHLEFTYLHRILVQ